MTAPGAGRGEDADLVELGRSLVEERFPGARAAFLAGSAGEGTANAFSDLDIVVVLPGTPAPYRETGRARGWPVEWFVHTDESLTYWFDRERREGTGILAHMIAGGRPLGGPEARAMQAAARSLVLDGPEPWDADRIDYRRYALSDALDDLAGARDVDERDVVAGLVLVLAAELHLALAGSWQGKGKWMLRRLRDVDATLSARLMSGHRAAVATGDSTELVRACDDVLAPVGGRLIEGFAVR